jgi:hypothetical protein
MMRDVDAYQLSASRWIEIAELHKDNWTLMEISHTLNISLEQLEYIVDLLDALVPIFSSKTTF